MAIIESKKRYQFSLDRTETDKLKAFFAKTGAPPDALSALVGNYVSFFVTHMEQVCKAKKKIGKAATYDDFLQDI